MSAEPMSTGGSNRTADQGQEPRGTERGPDGIEREHVHGDEDVKAAPTTATPDLAAGAVNTGRFGDTDTDSGYGTTTGYGAATANGARDQADIIIAPEHNADLHARWREIEAEFIDDPQHAAKLADQLAAEITKVFAAQAEQERNRLASWQHEGTHDTEELRLVMRRYRGLIHHMLDH